MRIGALVAGLTTLAGLAALVGGCDDPCANERVAERPAPDGRHVAVLFRRDCGATTGVSTQLSVLLTGEGSQGVGNAFRAEGALDVVAAWPAPDRLVVRYPADARVFLRAERVAGVGIAYEAVAR
jgi:hypothetical protein